MCDKTITNGFHPLKPTTDLINSTIVSVNKKIEIYDPN